MRPPPAQFTLAVRIRTLHTIKTVAVRVVTAQLRLKRVALARGMATLETPPTGLRAASRPARDAWRV